MMTSRLSFGILTAICMVAPAPVAAGLDFWSGRSPAERLVEQAVSARQRAEFRLASSLLDEAEAQANSPRALILRERGLLEQARGDLEDAARFLGEAADRDATSGARLDQTAVLVQLGRWPDAVVTLKRAFVERGSALRVEDVVADPRFASLSGFEPYEVLLNEARAEQAGPLGKFLLRVERIEASVQVATRILEQIADVAAFGWRVASAVGVAVIALILLGFVIGAGIHQLGIVRPPLPLVVGMLAASGLWHLGARVGSADQASGLETIGIALAVVFGPWILFVGGRGLWRLWRERRQGPSDPFAEVHLPHTLVLLEEVTSLGRRFLSASGEERLHVGHDLREAERHLKERLDARR
jgi:tetratricopeptide (TPR) repeat protein